MQLCLTSPSRKPRNDFKKPDNDIQIGKFYYDMEYDKALIESSFASQYHIRLRQEPDITLAEFFSLLSGLNEETALGRVVAIRMEKNPDVIRKFGDWEKKVRADWAQFKQKHFSQNPNLSCHGAGGETAQDYFKKMFGKAH